MRFYRAHVNIGGDRNHVLVKPNLTPAEIQVLQAVHGDADVYQISEMPNKGQDKTPHQEIKDHLQRRYGHTTVGPESNRIPVLRHVFPTWPNGNLPTDLNAAGIDPTLIAEDTRSKSKSKSQAKSKATSSDDTPETDNGDTSFAE